MARQRDPITSSSAGRGGRRALLRECRTYGWDEVRQEERLDFDAGDLERHPGLAVAFDRGEREKPPRLAVTTFGPLVRCLGELTRLLDKAAALQWALVGLDWTDDPDAGVSHVYATFVSLGHKIGQRGEAGRRQEIDDDVVLDILIARRDNKSLRTIAHELNDRRVPTTHGGARWYASTVRAVLNSRAAERVQQEVDESVESQLAGQGRALLARDNTESGQDDLELED